VTSSVPEGVVRAAGAVLWRGHGDDLEVALVHRPKYDDWSWPKGKLDDRESWPAAAVREVLEETGLHVRLGVPLPSSHYDVGSGGTVRPKVVQYWAAQVVAGSGELAHEVDEVEWLSPQAARRRLHYRRDLHQLAAVERADADDALDTWPLVVVRHASSVPRRRWRKPDARRPLDELGRESAKRLVPVLAAYHVRQVVTSDADRCSATVAPYAKATGARVRGRHGLSEEGFHDDPTRAPRAVEKVVARGEAAAVCSHRPVIPALLGALAERATSPEPKAALLESAGPGLVKGEVLVAHLRGVGDDAVVVAVERHDIG
jgi:8-oxo-dGTP diphosphatase